MNEDTQQPLFTEIQPREYQAGKLISWREEVPDETSDEVHETNDPLAERDEVDRVDDQAQKTMGKITLEASGMSPRKAARKLTAGVVRIEGDKIFERNALEKQVREAKIEAERDKKFKQAIKDSQPKKD